MMKLGDIFGQDAAIDVIRRAWRADRLPHGMIFAGPVGVGKATTARALGALFLCESPKGEEPCGRCEACHLMEAGTHPDWHVITKELIRVHDKTGKSKGIDLSIHVIQPELVAAAGLKAAMGRGKVFVVEQADYMTADAQNAMLKTLEEPAGRTLIVLLTDQPLQLLPTIRSRCQTVRFGALPPERVAEELKRRGIGGKDAADAARYADGSLGLALRWLEDGVIEAARELDERAERLFAGRAWDELPEWFRGAADAYAARQLDRDELSSKDQAMREAFSLYFRLLAGAIRRQLRAADGSDDLHRCCAALEAIARADQYLEGNVTVSLIFQQLAVTLESLYVRPAGASR